MHLIIINSTVNDLLPNLSSNLNKKQNTDKNVIKEKTMCVQGVKTNDVFGIAKSTSDIACSLNECKQSDYRMI